MKVSFNQSLLEYCQNWGKALPPTCVPPISAFSTALHPTLQGSKQPQNNAALGLLEMPQEAAATPDQSHLPSPPCTPRPLRPCTLPPQLTFAIIFSLPMMTRCIRPDYWTIWDCFSAMKKRMNRLLSVFSPFVTEQSHIAQQPGQACFSSSSSNKANVSWGNARWREGGGSKRTQIEEMGEGGAIPLWL